MIHVLYVSLHVNVLGSLHLSFLYHKTDIDASYIVSVSIISFVKDHTVYTSSKCSYKTKASVGKLCTDT